MFRKGLTIITVVVSLLVSCSSLTSYSAPPPGWNSPVSDLFVELNAFPEGWDVDPNEGGNAVDVRVNNASRTFFNMHPNKYDKTIQIIWRAYTVLDAEKQFSKLSKGLTSRGWLPRFPSTSFRPVSQITYQSKFADKWGLACGVDVTATCLFLARYHNYVTTVYFDLQYAGYEGLNFNEIEKLLSGVDEKFRDHLELTETSTDNPSYLSMTSDYAGPAANIEQFLLDAESIPKGWEIVFQDFEGITALSSGEYLASRNFSHNNCYLNSPELEQCYITQFVTWYPRVRNSEEAWQLKYSEINIGEPERLGVWRIPSDITLSGVDGDRSFVACSEVAGGEGCEAILQYNNYLIALIADMKSQTTLMGHSQDGLTHEMFAKLIKEIALHARTVLYGEK